MRTFNYSKIREQKWDGEMLGVIAAIYKAGNDINKSQLAARMIIFRLEDKSDEKSKKCKGLQGNKNNYCYYGSIGVLLCTRCGCNNK
jgi:hypothetical protein